MDDSLLSPEEFLCIEITEDDSNDILIEYQPPSPEEYNHDEHIQNVAGKFQCPQCPYTSKIERFVHNHIARVHTPIELVEWYHCSYCLFKTRTAVGIKVHTSHAHENQTRVQTVDGILENTQNDIEVEEKWYNCNMCSYKGRKVHHLASHMFHMHQPNGEMRWKCDRCSFKCRLHRTYRTHLKNVHSIM